MLSRYAVAVCSLATLLCLPCPAQSTPQSTAPAQSPSTAAPSESAPAQPPTAPLRLQNLPSDPHSPTPAEQQQQRQQQALAAAAQLAGAEARWGPPISTPGLSIALREVSRSKAPDGTTQIDYQITGSGFSPGDKLSLIRWPLDTSAKNVMSGIAINAKGVAVCMPPAPSPASAPGTPAAPISPAPAQDPPPSPNCTTQMQANQPLQIQTTAAPGEAVRVALIGDDRKHGAATSTIPFPIANEAKGCKLQVILGVKNADLVLVEGTGFPANAELRLETTTAGESRDISTKTNPDGRLVVAVLPAKPGQDTGDTTVRYLGVAQPPTLNTPAAAPTPAPACAPAVTFHWGQGTYKPQ